MDTIKLFFELDIEQFIGEIVHDEAVKETEKVLNDNIEIEVNDGFDLRGPLSQVTGKDDHRSDEVESQKQLIIGKTDVWEEKCLD